MADLTFRNATRADTERIAEIIADEPGQEAIGICGNRELARRFGMAFVRLRDSPQGWQHTLLAELRGEAVGIMQAGTSIRAPEVTPAVVLLALRVFGPLRFPGLLTRLRARGRVQTSRPAGSYYIDELDVHPAFRNRGIGGATLAHAEADATARGFTQMSLSTTTSNPARRLYERHGFRVIETKTDPAYERYTGIAGRLLLVRELAGAAPAAPQVP